MDKEIYLSELQAAIKKAGYGVRYIAKCTRYAERLIDNGLPVIFDMHHLTALIGADNTFLEKLISAEDYFYSERKIPKKRGGSRTLFVPSAELKYIQRWILDNILVKIQISDYATGFRNNMSILTNARCHVNKYCVVNIDIKDFFPSVSLEKIFRIFYYYGYTAEVSFVLAKLCTYRGRLPQGSPASPAISNIVCLKLDARLSALAAKYESTYSRYADDITFSSQHDAKSILIPAEKILQDEGFNINSDKTRIAYPHQRQEVTGLIVNNGSVRVPKKYKRDLRQELYYCSKYGVEGHMERIQCDKAFFKEYIYGKILFVSMVEPEEGSKLVKIADEIMWNY